MGVTTLALFLAKYHSSIIDFSEGQSRIQPLSSLQVLQTLLIFLSLPALSFMSATKCFLLMEF